MKTLVASTSHRVERHTSRRDQRRIEQRTRSSIRRHAAAGPQEIARRLRELDDEWDIERVIEANASTLALGGTLLGLIVNRWFLVLPLAVTGFLLQHSVQGWCPPVPLLRRLGFRTAREIHDERTALKILRGDFRGASVRRNQDRVVKSVRR